MKTIKCSVYFAAPPHEVFELLMDSKKHAGFTSHTAKISRAKNGAFSAYDGWIKGKNLEIVKDKKIVQAWRGADWKPGLYSRAEFSLAKKGRGCALRFIQTGVPDEKYAAINKGWKEHYWEKMKSYLKENKGNL